LDSFIVSLASLLNAAIPLIGHGYQFEPLPEDKEIQGMSVLQYFFQDSQQEAEYFDRSNNTHWTCTNTETFFIRVKRIYYFGKEFASDAVTINAYNFSHKTFFFPEFQEFSVYNS